MLLYKYCRPERIDILRTGMIALTRPRNFNDPFELHPNISRFDDDPGEMYHHILEKTSNFVVLSLAENCSSLLMWGHYTDAYRGFLIGFEGPDGILTVDSPHRDHGPVYYCHHRPSHLRFKEVTNHELFYTKSTEWAYEHEWRIIDSLMSADGDAFDPPDGHCWPFRFRPEAMREVIVGYRATDLVKDIISILRRPQYQHVKLLMAFPDHQRFELVFVEFQRDQWDTILADGEVDGHRVAEL